jgi:hypothetical protein
MASDSAPSPEPSRATRTPDRVRLETTHDDGGTLVRYRGPSPAHAMHHLAWVVNHEATESRAIRRVALQDLQGTHGVKAARNARGEFELEFQTPDAQALYRQIVRERQMELAMPADNEISALAPVQQRQARAKGDSTTRDAESIEGLQRSIAAALDPPKNEEASTRRRDSETERLVLERATLEQLKELKHLADTAQPKALREGLRDLQRQIENEVAREDDGRGPSMRRTPSATTPVNERFTAQQRLGRRDYWMRDRPDRLAFTQTWLRLRTKEHSAAAIMGMVDRALELGWKRLHLDGTPEFKREAWILASARGLSVRGYTATLGDREAAEAERRRIETTPKVRRDGSTERQATDRRPRPERDQAGRYLARQPSESRPTLEAMRQILRKAMADAKTPPELEGRLLGLLDTEQRRRLDKGVGQKPQVWDPAAPRVRAEPAAPQRSRRDVQRDR